MHMAPIFENFIRDPSNYIKILNSIRLVQKTYWENLKKIKENSRNLTIFVKNLKKNGKNLMEIWQQIKKVWKI